MAIPSNFIDKFTNKDTGESRPISPAADMVRVDNENFEGSDLDEVLNEVHEAIEEAGSGDGTVTAVKINNGTPIEPDENGVVNLGTVITSHQDVSGKADKSEMSVVPGTGSNADKTTITLKQGTSATVLTQHQDVSNLATKTEVNAKANAADVYTKSQTDAAIQEAVEDIPAGQDGITPHIGSNGHWWLGDENDSENDTGVTAQGPAGESITDADLTIGNALNGQGDVLGMQGAMQMKANIDSLFTSLNRLYTKLGNMAFWDAADKTAAAPTALDWQVPQVTVTLDKTGLSANAMITNASDQEITGTSVSVDQGSGLTLKIKPRPDHAITAASATIGGVSQTLTESGGIYTLTIANVTSAITIVFSVTAQAAIRISYGTLTNCSVPSGVINPTAVLSGQSTSIQLQADADHAIKAADITISGASVGTITHSGQVYTIQITHDGTSQSISIAVAASEAIPYAEPEGGGLLYWWDGMTIQSGDTAWVDRVSHISVPKASNNDAETTPDPTNHCWNFNSGYNTNNHGLAINNSSLDDIDADDCTIEVVYKAEFDNSFTRANVCIFHRRESSGTYDVPGGIYFCSKNGTSATDAYICGCNAGDVNDGTWDNSNVNDEICLIGMNNDDAVKNGSALALKTGTNATGHVDNTGSTAGEGAICIGCYSNKTNKYSVFKGNIYAIRIYSGHLTAAQMLANQKVDNERYNLGLTLPDSVQ